MDMIKRLLAVTLLVTVMLCLVACAGNQETKQPTVCTTIPTTATTNPTTVPATVPTTEPEAEYTYSIRLVDQNGQPIEGAVVSFGLDPYITYETNENGLVLINVEIMDGYKAHIERLPEGYEDYVYPDVYIFFAPGQHELQLVAVKPKN